MTDPSKAPKAVGYGNPPTETRFRKGQSGNPKGRPKGAKNLATALEAELSARVPITENGKRKTASKRDVISKVLVNKAVQGDPKATALVLQHGARPPASVGSAVSPDFDDLDHRVIPGIVRRIRAMTLLPDPAAEPGDPSSQSSTTERED